VYFRLAVPILTWLFIGAASNTTTADDIIPAGAIYGFASMFAYELLGVVYAYFHKRDSISYQFSHQLSPATKWLCDHYEGLFMVFYFLTPAAVIATMWAFGLNFHAMDDRPWGILPAIGMLFVGCFCFTVLDFLSCCFTLDYGDEHSPWSARL
jgi:hypothetical protein